MPKKSTIIISLQRRSAGAYYEITCIQHAAFLKVKAQDGKEKNVGCGDELNDAQVLELQERPDVELQTFKKAEENRDRERGRNYNWMLMPPPWAYPWGY